jgi:D-alanine--poly(phosphoribitol) ligase subunit 2
MTKQQYEAWLREWLTRSAGMPADALGRDLFSEGWLDSLATLRLILEIETALNIRLSEAELADKRLSSIAGLAEMLSERASAGAAGPAAP